jgi:hypothetical protein
MTCENGVCQSSHARRPAVTIHAAARSVRAPLDDFDGLFEAFGVDAFGEALGVDEDGDDDGDGGEGDMAATVSHYHGRRAPW